MICAGGQGKGGCQVNIKITSAHRMSKLVNNAVCGCDKLFKLHGSGVFHFQLMAWLMILFVWQVYISLYIIALKLPVCFFLTHHTLIARVLFCVSEGFAFNFNLLIYWQRFQFRISPFPPSGVHHAKRFAETLFQNLFPGIVSDLITFL